MRVTPGLIDLHSHNFHGMRAGDPVPDGFKFRRGIRTTVDAGSSGWKSFERFKAETNHQLFYSASLKLASLTFTELFPTNTLKSPGSAAKTKSLL